MDKSVKVRLGCAYGNGSASRRAGAIHGIHTANRFWLYNFLKVMSSVLPLWPRPCGQGSKNGLQNTKIQLIAPQKPTAKKQNWRKQAKFCCGFFFVTKLGAEGYT
jgi:hypothetical protein